MTASVPASRRRRLYANAIDAGLLGVPSLVLLVLAWVEPMDGTLYGWSIPVLWVIYQTSEIIVGATPGKRLMRQRVAHCSGKPVGLTYRLIRWLWKWLTLLLLASLAALHLADWLSVKVAQIPLLRGDPTLPLALLESVMRPLLYLSLLWTAVNVVYWLCFGRPLHDRLVGTDVSTSSVSGAQRVGFPVRETD